jgi:hypothetical protein
MKWAEFEKSQRVAVEERAKFEAEWIRERFGNDCAARVRALCAMSLADVDPRDLLELGTGLVRVKCLQLQESQSSGASLID